MLYDNATRTSYQELMAGLPVWYEDSLEMTAIQRALGSQLDGLQAGVAQAIHNNFIPLADEATIRQWEVFLRIDYDRTKTLDERKAYILSFLLSSGHIGEREIKEIVGIYTDEPCTVELIGGTIAINILRESMELFGRHDMISILARKIPAHLALFTRNMYETRSEIQLGGFSGIQINTSSRPSGVARTETRAELQVGALSGITINKASSLPDKPSAAETRVEIPVYAASRRVMNVTSMGDEALWQQVSIR